jgi:hypothetical protein
MPVMPAWLVRSNLNDPRRIPYLLVWKDEKHDGEIMEAVRLAHGGFANLVEMKRSDGSTTVLRIVWRMLPRNGGRALLLACSSCGAPCRHVYGWEWDRVSGWSNRIRNVSWRCRSCARLRYSSEGSALLFRGGRISRLLRHPCPDLRSPRPDPWLPCVFTDIDQALEAIR